MKTYRYKLQPYTGITTRHTCPQCGAKHKFSRYIDTLTGQPINDTVGRCERSDNCGYHYKPYEYFRDLKHRGITELDPLTSNRLIDIAKTGTEPLTTIPAELIQNLFAGKQLTPIHLLTFITKQLNLSPSQTNTLIQNYQLLPATFGRILFPQIDTNGNYRTAKIMGYDPHSGKRLKNLPGSFNWAHSILIKQNKLPADFQLKQCLFGEHLLPRHPTKPIGLVESEKTALICSITYPKFLWLATGGKHNFTAERLQPLAGRIITAMPDAGTYHLWTAKTKQIKRTLKCQLHISDCIERTATLRETEQGIDIADLILTNRTPHFF